MSMKIVESYVYELLVLLVLVAVVGVILYPVYVQETSFQSCTVRLESEKITILKAERVSPSIIITVNSCDELISIMKANGSNEVFRVWMRNGFMQSSYYSYFVLSSDDRVAYEFNGK